jgi:hypothetical protein
MTHHPQPAKSVSDEQIAEIKRIDKGDTTSKSGLAWMYGLTLEQLEQVIKS